MDIRENLLKEHTKKQAMHIANWVGKDGERFAALVSIMMAKEERVSQRAAWVVGHCLDQHPDLIHPHLELLVDNLHDRTHHDAIRRNTMRALQEVDLPESLWGEVADFGFKYLADPQEAIAVRVFAMSVLWNICQKEPELKNELKLIIEDQWEFASAGFRSRGRKILKRIEKDSRKSRSHKP